VSDTLQKFYVFEKTFLFPASRKSDIESWTVTQVAGWIEALQLEGQYISNFLQNSIDG
jgi:hypothetical protein